MIKVGLREAGGSFFLITCKNLYKARKVAREFVSRNGYTYYYRKRYPDRTVYHRFFGDRRAIVYDHNFNNY